MKKLFLGIILFGALSFANATQKSEVSKPVKEMFNPSAISTNAP